VRAFFLLALIALATALPLTHRQPNVDNKMEDNIETMRHDLDRIEGSHNAKEVKDLSKALEYRAKALKEQSLEAEKAQEEVASVSAEDAPQEKAEEEAHEEILEDTQEAIQEEAQEEASVDDQDLEASRSFDKTLLDLEAVRKEVVQKVTDHSKRSEMIDNIDAMTHDVNRLKTSRVKSEQKNLREALRLRFEALKEMNTELEKDSSVVSHAGLYSKSKSDLEKVRHDVHSSHQFSRSQVNQIEDNLNGMKKDLEELSFAPEASRSSNLKKALGLRVKALREQLKDSDLEKSADDLDF